MNNQARAILDRLVPEGWSWTERGRNYDVADLELMRGDTTIEVDHAADVGLLYVFVATGEEELGVRVRCDESLPQVLDVIAAHAGTVEAGTAGPFLLELLGVGHDVEALVGEELVPKPLDAARLEAYLAGEG